MKHDFKFISKHSPSVRSTYANLQDILNQVHRILRNEYTFQHKPVGSYSRNMITYDTKPNVGYDFDINIYPNDEDNNLSPPKKSNCFSRKHWIRSLQNMVMIMPKIQHGYLPLKLKTERILVFCTASILHL